VELTVIQCEVCYIPRSTQCFGVTVEDFAWEAWERLQEVICEQTEGQRNSPYGQER
jgi:hypothetical protein